ncbi:hypothetical protein [Halobaculum lipolyticum]|uniref:DUF2207 domain-containing protein n=1 Tax=Halobaculum lipolyticum TaxID=3032001 RepID=A0ABD5WJA7_9EURY|nr:hypothetical protein [Halobaculum sp. DT31]
MPIRNLTIYDVLAVTIPGSLLLLLQFPSAVAVRTLLDPPVVAVPPLGDATVSVAFLIVSYTLGTLIQGVAERPIARTRRRRPAREATRRKRRNKLKREKPGARGEGRDRRTWSRTLSFAGLQSVYDDRFVETSVYNSRELDRPFDAQVVRRFDAGDADALVERARSLLGLELLVDDGEEPRLNRSKLGRFYWLAQSYLFTRGIDRAKRWSLLEKFHRGMWISFVSSAVVNGTAAVALTATVWLSPAVPSALGTPLVTLLALVLLYAFAAGFALVGSVVSHQERRKYGRYWGSALLDDFLTADVPAHASGTGSSGPTPRLRAGR